MRHKKQIRAGLMLFLLAFILPPATFAQKTPEHEGKAKQEGKAKDTGKASDDAKNEKDKEEIINEPGIVWHDPGDISQLNLMYGAGGKDHAPSADDKFTFIREDMNGTSPKFDVKDQNGVEWKVKMGAEPQSETAANRFMWATGYFVDEDYYLAEFKVQGMPKLRRGQNFVSADGIVHRARLKRKLKEVKKLGNWDWFHNQCMPVNEFNGLRVMMAFINNWDLKNLNNAMQEVNGQPRCAVTDLGASFGKTGNSLSRSKSSEKDYANSDFIAKVTPTYVDFVMHSRPFFLTAINIPNEIKRGKMEEITKHIPIEDARAIGKRLAQLSEQQIRDAFRAGGYTADEVDGYTKTVKSRIAELNSLDVRNAPHEGN